MAENFKRICAISDAHLARVIEKLGMETFESYGIHVEPNSSAAVGIRNNRKAHPFDLGTDNPLIIIECKSHRWTSS